MKKLLFLLSPALLLLFISCKKDPDIGPPAKINPGIIQFTIKNTVTLKETFSAVKAVIGDKEYELNNFCYTKAIPSDSMSYYWKLFKSCSYIYAYDVFKKPAENFTRFRDVNFKNLNAGDFAKWDSIVKAEKLVELPDDGEGQFPRNGLLFVPQGEEKMWIDALKKLPVIQNADFVFAHEGGFF